MDLFSSPWFLPGCGVLAGAVMGYAARRHHFCTMSAIERFFYAGDSTGIRTWAMAAAVALVLTQALALAGFADIHKSFYLMPAFGWTGAIIGGLAFGAGMALVGTCGFGALVRAGGGSLRSVVVLLVLGLSAMAAQKGLIALVRVPLVDELALDLSAAGDQSLGAIASHLIGADVRLAVAVIAAAGLFAFVFRDRSWHRGGGRLLTASAIGGAIGFGWLVTTLAARSSLDPVQIEAGSFAVPVADTILQVITYTGVLPDYGIGVVIGVLVGAAACAVQRRDVRWEACDDARELSRHLLGGFLMGTGGVFALGCTIGQGITAVSALAVSAPVVLVSIALGARLGLAYLVEGSPVACFRIGTRQPAD